MFNNNDSNISPNVSHIGEGLQVEGDLTCRGTIEISGIMNGNIKAHNIKLLETGSIMGSVKAEIFEVFGYVEGETEAGEVKIGKTATIKGDVYFKENLKKLRAAAKMSRTSRQPKTLPKTHEYQYKVGTTYGP